MRRLHAVIGSGLMFVAAFVSRPADAQLPLTSPKSSGQNVTPAYEGWYQNPWHVHAVVDAGIRATEIVKSRSGQRLISPGAQNQDNTEFSRAAIGAFAVACRRLQEERNCLDADLPRDGHSWSPVELAD
jgi:hypothetical protein